MNSETFDATFAPQSYDPSQNPVPGARMPQMEPGEVEIAGIEFLSRVVSPISIRALTGGGLTRYRVIDGFGSRFTVAKATSVRPLTLAELIDLIDGTVHEFGVGLTDVYRDLYSDPSDPTERAASFVRVISAYYPQLEEYYAERSRSWLQGARGELAAPEWLAARVAAFHESVALRTAPPLHPFDLPDYRRIDELSEVERVQIARWLRTETGYPGSTVSWSTTTAEMRRSRRMLDTRFSVCFGPGPGDLLEITRPFSSAVRYPGVRAFFASLAADIGDTRTRTVRGVEPETEFREVIADDVWAAGDIEAARLQVGRVLAHWPSLHAMPLESVAWAAEFFLAVGDSVRARELWIGAHGPGRSAGRIVASLRGRAVIAAVEGDIETGLGLLAEASRFSEEETA